MKKRLNTEIFKKGSKTYFTASYFLPQKIKDDVFILYAFVRTADNFVDATPQDVDGFNAFCQQYWNATANKTRTGNEIIDDFVLLATRCNFKSEWIEVFLRSMKLDFSKKKYDTIEELLEYIHGSAEVIGLMLCAIMGLPENSFYSAKMLGRAMQLINFIRDIDEDNSLGRRYLPFSELPFEISSKYAQGHPAEFSTYIKIQADRYLAWQKEAELGYHYIPRRARVAIKTAADMYQWTARKIQQNPMSVFKKKVKPSKVRILLSAIKNIFFL